MSPLSPSPKAVWFAQGYDHIGPRALVREPGARQADQRRAMPLCSRITPMKITRCHGRPRGKTLGVGGP